MIYKLVVLIFLAVIGFFAYVFGVTRDLPSIDKVLHEGVNPNHWTQVFAVDGTPILSYGKFHHRNVPLEQISPHFIDALLATEDRRFYQHHGVDPIGILRAIANDVIHRRIMEGGSTLTQQLARNVFLSNERSFSRKIREAALALELERRLSKRQILELYVNNIYFGEGAYGIEAASEIYFNKRPAQLTIPEAAMLAGLPQAPSEYSPFHDHEGALRRRNEVLKNLKATGKLTDEALDADEAVPLHVNPNGQLLAASDKAPFFNRYVMRQVQRSFDLDEQSFWQSGLKVYTTLDLNAQRLAEETLRARSAAFGRRGRRQQAALVSISPQTGAILAYVGGQDYQHSQFDRVMQAQRSPGSLFKVFTYTTAIDRGYEPSRVYLDAPVQFGNWQPTNYDKGYHGYMTIAHALVISDNIVASKVINELGADAVVSTAQKMGIKSPLAPYLGLTLGGSDVNLLEITSAFGVLANQGVRVEPYGIERIDDESNHTLYKNHPLKTDVLNRTTVDTMVKMMMGVIARGTGRAADIGRPAAGKTGTSDDYRDAWFIGFTPDVVTGVWVGNDDNTPMPGMTGGSLPAVIWHAFMQAYMANRPVSNFDLAYSKPLAESDFVTYDLKNLSDHEKGTAQAGQLDQGNASPSSSESGNNPQGVLDMPPNAPMTPLAPEPASSGGPPTAPEPPPAPSSKPTLIPLGKPSAPGRSGELDHSKPELIPLTRQPE